jgi:streptogramin lyase
MNQSAVKSVFQAVATAAVVGLVLALAGCGSGVLVTNGTGTGLQTISGKAHGGVHSISGGTVQLYAVGISGLKSAATPLIASTVLTRSDGTFSVAGSWNCSSNLAAYGTDPLLYMTVTGGNPGLGAGTNNRAIAVMAALGPCSGVTSSTFVSIDEVTTVAAIAALAPFMSDTKHVGASGAGSPGLVNAFKTAALLSNTTTGTAPGTNLFANVSVPISRINALANLLSSCVITTGTTTACSNLFASTTPVGGTASADTASALLNIVRNPGTAVAQLFNTIPPNSPFQPTLLAAPKDWTVALSFSGGGLRAPTGIALDAQGNAWIANSGGNSVTEFSSTGQALTGTFGYTGNRNIFGAQAIAVDRSGNVWIADTLLSTIVKLTLGGGAVQVTESYAAGSASGPTGIAIDSQNNVWVSNFAGGSVTELSSRGAVLGTGPLTAGGSLRTPVAIALDSKGDAWFPDLVGGVIGKYDSSQALQSGSGYTDSGLLAPAGIAIDAAGRAWVTNSGTDTLSIFEPSGAPLSQSPLSGGLNRPSGIAIDGSGVAWVANAKSSGNIAELSLTAATPASPTIGFGTLSQPMGIAVDASGNVWTANAGDNTVSLFVGLATPVATPIAITAGP